MSIKTLLLLLAMAALMFCVLAYTNTHPSKQKGLKAHTVNNVAQVMLQLDPTNSPARGTDSAR